MGEMMGRLQVAMNDHDVDAFVACFAPGYRSEQPAHPGRDFAGADKVRENWTQVFGGVPDFRADLISWAATGDGTEVGEWHWHGTHTDGSRFTMAGTTVMGIEGGQIAWGRLYMEAVEQGADIDQMVRDTYQPPAAP